MAITMEMPEKVLYSLNMTGEEVSRDMRQLYAARLYQQGRLSLGQAAEFCGMNKFDFPQVLSSFNIPVVDYDPAELEDEVASFV